MSSNPRTLRRSFAGGEVTPEFFGRIDDAKFQTGLAACRNFIVKPHGAIENRAGLAFVREVKTSAKKTRIIPFVFAFNQSLVVEIGEGYFRFHTFGATLLAPAAAAWVTAIPYVVAELVTHGGTTYYCRSPHNSGVFATDLAAGRWYALPATGEYEIPNAYDEDDLAGIRFTQSNDVLTLTHPGYAPAELRRRGATDWTFAAISFAPVLSPPASVSATGTPAATSPGTPSLQSYVVTAVRGVEESQASSEL